jgi:hypothetical protein
MEGGRGRLEKVGQIETWRQQLSSGMPIKQVLSQKMPCHPIQRRTTLHCTCLSLKWKSSAKSDFPSNNPVKPTGAAKHIRILEPRGKGEGGKEREREREKERGGKERGRES